MRFGAVPDSSRSARTCATRALPNGPKVGSGGSLSPRGDWRAPSDATAAAWLRALDQARAWAGDR